MIKDTYIGNMKLTSGDTKICVPVTAHTYKEIIDEISNIVSNFDDCTDIIEYRADYFEKIFDNQAVDELFSGINQIPKDIPVLFTFRTSIEGGERDIDPEVYKELIIKAIDSGAFSAVDVEINRGDALFCDIVEYAKKHNVTVIASYHDFEKTPDNAFITNQLSKMEKQGADIAKIAVMPKNEEDVLRLINASFEAKNNLSIPIVSISMGEMGALSRVAGKITG